MVYDVISMEQMVIEALPLKKIENIPDSNLVNAEKEFCRYILSLSYHSRRENVAKELPWPSKQETVEERKDYFYPILETIGKLSEEDRIDFAEYFWINKNIFIDAYSDYNSSCFSELKAIVFSGLNWDNPKIKPLNKEIVEYFTAAIVGKNDYEQEAYRMFFGDCVTIESNDIFPLVLMGLADKEEKELIEEGAFGFILMRFSPPDVINQLRRMIENSESQENKEKLEKIVAKVQGLMEGVAVHTSLESVYSSIQFENYPVSEFTRPKRIEFLKGLIEEKAIGKDGRVLDVASGTGWLVGLMREDLGMRNVWGVDINIKNLETATNIHGDYFSASSWDKLPFSTNQFSLVTCLGRSLPHAENELNFENALRELERVTVQNGYLIFDMPSSIDGDYAKNIEKFKTALRNVGCPERELIDLPYVVDSPDGKNFYNRFVPKREWIEKVLSRRFNFELKVIEEDIPNEKGEPNGNKNLVFICRKR